MNIRILKQLTPNYYTFHIFTTKKIYRIVDQVLLKKLV
jgi:hypothetical protein